MKARDWNGNQTQLVAMANADLESRLEDGIGCTARQIEQEHKLKPGQVKYFRANRTKRKTPVPDMKW